MDKKDRKNRNKKIIGIGLRTLAVLCVVGLFGFLIYRIHVLENRQQQYASEIKGLTSELGLSAGNQGFTVSWAGKTWATYGDSITQNGGWQDYITEYFGFARHDNCGIGSSTFIQSDLVWYANPDGTYNSRYGFLGVTEAPEGTTEHEAYLCSEDRIQTQLDPDLDLVLIMGGTNDAGITVSAPLGDLSYPYDETTFMGAVASTVVKIQEQCPHAIIVLASPLSGSCLLYTSGAICIDNHADLCAGISGGYCQTECLERTDADRQKKIYRLGGNRTLADDFAGLFAVWRSSLPGGHGL